MSRRSDLADEIAEVIADMRAGRVPGSLAATTIGCIVVKHEELLLAALRDAPSTESGGGPERDPDGSGWQPADTAPVNVAIQVYIPHLDYYGNQGVYAGMFVDMGTGQRWMTFAWAMGRDMCGENRPTHWRPLPAPPRVSDEQPQAENAKRSSPQGASAVGAAETPLHPDPNPRSDPETAGGENSR